MRTYIFSDPDALQLAGTSPGAVRGTIGRIAEGTDASDLVVAVYFLATDAEWGGVARARCWSTPRGFCLRRGRWSFTRRFGRPGNLPSRFKLILLRFGLCGVHYPRCDTDRYGWKWRWGSLEDHVGDVFAHELFHFRCDHLGLHPGGKERLANMWALARVQAVGLAIAGHAQTAFRQSRRRAIDCAKGVNLTPRPRLLGRAKMIAAHLSPDDLLQLAAWCSDRREELSEGLAEQKRRRADEPSGLPVLAYAKPHQDDRGKCAGRPAAGLRQPRTDPVHHASTRYASK